MVRMLSATVQVPLSKARLQQKALKLMRAFARVCPMETAMIEEATTDEEDNAIEKALRAATSVAHAPKAVIEDLADKPLYRCSLQEVRQIAAQLGFDLQDPTLRTRVQIEGAISLSATIRRSPSL